MMRTISVLQSSAWEAENMEDSSDGSLNTTWESKTWSFGFLVLLQDERRYELIGCWNKWHGLSSKTDLKGLDWVAGDSVSRLESSWDGPVYITATFPATVWSPCEFLVHSKWNNRQQTKWNTSWSKNKEGKSYSYLTFSVSFKQVEFYYNCVKKNKKQFNSCWDYINKTEALTNWLERRSAYKTTDEEKFLQSVCSVSLCRETLRLIFCRSASPLSAYSRLQEEMKKRTINYCLREWLTGGWDMTSRLLTLSHGA